MNTKNWTDEAIIQALRRGDPDRRRAWEYMYKNWRDVWAGLVVQRGGTPGEAAEAMNEVALPFEKVVRSPAFQLDTATLKTYLARCVLNRWIRLRKKQQNEPANPGREEAAIKSVVDSVEKQVMGRDLRKSVDELIDILGERCRRVLRLFFYQDASMEKIAEAEGWKDAAKAKKEKYECQTKLKNHLRENPDKAKRLKELLYD